MIIMVQVLREKWFENDGFCSFTTNQTNLSVIAAVWWTTIAIRQNDINLLILDWNLIILNWKWNESKTKNNFINGK